MRIAAAALALLPLAPPALADVPRILAARAVAEGNGRPPEVTVEVTVAHPDTGWDHYADAWEVHAPDGTRIGLRELLHPHETEQPFTRSLSGVAVPDGAGHILIRARCSVDGWASDTFRVDLAR